MNVVFDPADLKPLITAVMTEVLARADEVTGRLGTQRLGYSEAEAAALLGVPRHVLRDARLRKEVAARLVGKKFIYSREALMRYLTERQAQRHRLMKFFDISAAQQIPAQSAEKRRENRQGRRLRFATLVNSRDKSGNR